MPILGILFSSPGGVSSPIPSTWLSVNHKDPSLGLKACPTEFLIPVATTFLSRSPGKRLKLIIPPIPTSWYRSNLSAGATL